MRAMSLVGEVPASGAAAWGRKKAIVFRDRAISYDGLARDVAAMASKLTGIGIEPGQRIAILMENRPEYVVAWFAVPAAGAVLVPLNTFLAPAELRRILEDSGATGLIVSAESLTRVEPALAHLPDLRHILLCDAPAADAAPARIPSRIRLTVPDAAPESRRPEPVRSRPPAGAEEIAVLVYTSGTTGEPKGVMLSHGNLLSNAESCIRAVGVTRKDRVILFLPMFHSFTGMVGILAPLMAGMTIVLCEKLDRAEIRRALRRHRPTIFPGVPSVFTAMAQAKISPLARWLNPVRLYVSGGAPLPLETLQRFEAKFRRPLCEGYGLSEAAPVVALNPPEGPRKPGSVGPPVPGVEVRIVDAEGRDADVDQPGELLVRGPNVMQGYYQRPAENVRVLQDGWLRTGDVARRDGDGYLFIVGRSKDIIISRGMNVYPREIEEVLERHPMVKEAAVIGVPDTSRGEVPFAFVIAHPGGAPGESELRRLCLDSLARYKVPRTIRVVEELPRNAAGKVMKQELRKMAGPLTLQAGIPLGRPAGRARRHGT